MEIKFVVIWLFFALITTGVLAYMRFSSLYGKLDSLIQDESSVGQKSVSELRVEYGKLAWAKEVQPNPVRVIALRQFLNRKDNASEFQKLMSLVSDYYGQTKHLLKMRRPFMALVFFYKSWEYATTAESLFKNGMYEPTALEYEVLGARYFALSAHSRFGKLLGFFFKDKALKYLWSALDNIDVKINKSASASFEQAWQKTLFLSKLYKLTGDESYRLKVKGLPLGKEHVQNLPDQMKRIANHLGFDDATGLLLYCHSN